MGDTVLFPEVELVEVYVVARNKKRTCGLQSCAFCRRQAGAVDSGAVPAVSGPEARITLVDGIDDSYFMAWMVLFKKYTAQDTRSAHQEIVRVTWFVFRCMSCVLHVCAMHSMQSLYLSVLLVSGNGDDIEEH